MYTHSLGHGHRQSGKKKEKKKKKKSTVTKLIEQLLVIPGNS